jgi:hypothetical protein
MNKNKSSISFWLLSGLLILIAGLLAFIHLEEWYVIGVLEKTAGYPFGGEGPTPYYYDSPDLYARVNLIWGILFSVALTFGITTIVKKNITGLVAALGTTVLMAVVMFAQGMI